VSTAALTIFALAAAAMAAPQAAARWNPKAPENTELQPGFSPEAIEPVLAAIGARYQRAGTPEKPQLLVVFANGRKATLAMSGCGADGCKALSIQSFWTPLATATPQQTARAIERFNRRVAFAKAFVASDGRPALQRYLTADYGFIRGDLAVNLLVFAEQADRFARDVLQPLGRS
jgi:hypothetical protein